MAAQEVAFRGIGQRSPDLHLVSDQSGEVTEQSCLPVIEGGQMAVGRPRPRLVCDLSDE